MIQIVFDTMQSLILFFARILYGFVVLQSFKTEIKKKKEEETQTPPYIIFIKRILCGDAIILSRNDVLIIMFVC